MIIALQPKFQSTRFYQGARWLQITTEIPSWLTSMDSPIVVVSGSQLNKL